MSEPAPLRAIVALGTRLVNALPEGNSSTSFDPPQTASLTPESDAAREFVTTVPENNAEDSAAFPTVPGYHVLGELGRGGMGVVYQAKQANLNRLVALKIVLSGRYAGASDRTRFRREAEAIARLAHPNIVQVYEVGEYDGTPYFSLEYCSEGSLGRRIYQDGPLPPAAAARLVETLAHAVQHAHAQGIVHRDLKPGNILLQNVECGMRNAELTDAGEPEIVIGSGNSAYHILHSALPKIADFGLAKVLDSDDTHTRTGAVVGTPAYMAPEQASGQNRLIGPAVDIYALGAIFYECLTGRPPFRGSTPVETIDRVLRDDPVPPSQRLPGIPTDLEAICLKCLQKRPENRYAAAGELAEDLRRYRDGEPVQARPSNVWSTLGRIYERSEQDVAFVSWYPLLFGFAAVFLTVHIAAYIIVNSGAHPYYARMTRLAGGVIMFAMFWIFRRGRLLPRNHAERQLWSIWVGYIVAALLITRVPGLFADPIAILTDPGKYYCWTLLAGMAFFAMGNAFWGRCYLIGMMFFAASVWLHNWPREAALIYGSVWAVALALLGFRLRSLRRQLEALKRDQPGQPAR